MNLGPSKGYENQENGRRRFLARLTMLAASIAGALVAIPSVAFLDPSALPWAGVTAQTAAWLRHVSADKFIAFSVDCTHFGWPVRWLQSAELFMCPCHGGVFYANGTVASGPPPKPLTQYPVRVQDGEVQILTSPLPITTT